MKRGFTTHVLWFNLQGAKRVSCDYQFRKKVPESSGHIVLYFNVVGVLNIEQYVIDEQRRDRKWIFQIQGVNHFKPRPKAEA